MAISAMWRCCCCLMLLLVLGLLPMAEAQQQQGNDLQCLSSVKSSVRDDQGALRGWDFSGDAQICTFAGVTCLHQNDSKVYSLNLAAYGLSGSFPSGFASCTSLTALDISQNRFTGPIPEELCKMLPYLVTFSASSNMISGVIPAFDNCSYLNNLDLSNNRLTGSIPGGIGLLSRLSKFDVSNNRLSGPIPYTLANQSADKFLGNPALCGKPLKSCSASSRKSVSVGLIVGVAAGATLLLAAIVVLALWLMPKRVAQRPAAAAKDEWAKKIKSPSSVTVSMFDKPLSKMKLSDLIAATKGFSPENIISSTRTGVVYAATLPDGSLLAVKRLSVAARGEEFRTEMEILGRLRHRNLVPLLGYCVAGDERLLVYKQMPNGSVSDWLHGERRKQGSFGWTKRLKIAVGASKGLAWLHHSCNPRIIHRNISASSLLLDDDFEARITDFGLARLMNPVDTHISTLINGDFGDVGYVAPEYARTLVATAKGDVYALGVVLLELVTGQKPVDVEQRSSFRGSLVEWTELHNREGRLEQIVDEELRSSDPEVRSEVMQFLKVASSCVLSTARERPSSFEVYQLLRAIGVKYHFSDQNEEAPLFASVVVDVETPEELIVARPGV